MTWHPQKNDFHMHTQFTRRKIITMIKIEFWKIFEDNKDDYQHSFQFVSAASRKKDLKIPFVFDIIAACCGLFHTWTRLKELYNHFEFAFLRKLRNRSKTKVKFRRGKIKIVSKAAIKGRSQRQRTKSLKLIK